MCSPVCSSAIIGCTYDIPTGIYNMYVYDIEEEGTLSDEWAISSSNITITGLETTYMSVYNKLRLFLTQCSIIIEIIYYHYIMYVIVIIL